MRQGWVLRLCISSSQDEDGAMLDCELEHGQSGSVGPEPSAEDKERLAEAAAAAAAAQQSGSKLLGSSKMDPPVL